MTLNDLQQSLCVKYCFRVESFSADALVLRHDCRKIDGDAHLLPAAKMCPVVCGFCRYSSAFAGEVVSNKSTVVENAMFLFRSLYFPYEVPH